MNALWPMLLIPSLLGHGVATYYTFDDYGGGPLYCAGRAGYPVDMIYDTRSIGKYNWVAVDVEAYQSGKVKCGDTLRVTFDNNTTLEVLALDAGPFGKYYIQDWPDLPILVDFAEHCWPLDAWSAVVDVEVIDGTGLQEVRSVGAVQWSSAGRWR